MPIEKTGYGRCERPGLRFVGPERLHKVCIKTFKWVFRDAIVSQRAICPLFLSR
jgi:hypothetical protein